MKYANGCYSYRSTLKCVPIRFLLELIYGLLTLDSSINVHKVLEFLNMDEGEECAGYNGCLRLRKWL